MRRTLFLAVIAMFVVSVSIADAAREDCGALPNDPPKPIAEVAAEDPTVQNDYDEVIEEDDRPGVVYLSVIGGDSPRPNSCGLSPSNAEDDWTGWGGPLDGDNVTIGEGPDTRNEIVIGGTYFVRGIGTHSVGTFVYDLSGGDYVSFEGWVGMSDEKDPAECDHGGSSDFTFNIDGTEVFKSDVLTGTVDGVNVEPVKVEFDIPAGAEELEVIVGDGGDGAGCDHGAIGDAKLMTADVGTSVEPKSKLSTTWAEIKSNY